MKFSALLILPNNSKSFNHFTVPSYQEIPLLSFFALQDWWFFPSQLTWTYDPTFAQPVSYTDQNGNQTLYEIDPANGNVLSVTYVVDQVDDESNSQTDDVVVSYTYTGAGDSTLFGLVKTETDPLGRITAYSYNVQGLVETITYATGTDDEASVSFEYTDGSDNVTAYVDEVDRRTEYEYDRLHRLLSIHLPDEVTGLPTASSPTIEYAYDTMSRLTLTTDELLRETAFAYDGTNRKDTVTRPDHDEDGSPT